MTMFNRESKFVKVLSAILMFSMLLGNGSYALGADTLLSGGYHTTDPGSPGDSEASVEEPTLTLERDQVAFTEAGQEGYITAFYGVDAAIANGPMGLSAVNEIVELADANFCADILGGKLEWLSDNSAVLAIGDVTTQLVQGTLGDDETVRRFIVSSAHVTWNGGANDEATYTVRLSGSNEVLAQGKAVYGISNSAEYDEELQRLIEQMQNGESNDEMTDASDKDSVLEQIRNAESIEIAKFLLEMYTEMGYGYLTEEEVAALGVNVAELKAAGYDFEAAALSAAFGSSDDDFSVMENFNLLGDSNADDKTGSEKSETESAESSEMESVENAVVDFGDKLPNDEAVILAELEDAENIQIVKHLLAMYEGLGYGRLTEEEVAELGIDVDALVEAG